jgi:class 3 adenylate cyclase
MTEREELEKAMAALDGRRTVLGDAAVETALAGLRQKLAALDKGESTSPTLAGERRVVTVLFCDVKGSTAMAEKFDPEEWAGIMKRAFTYLIPPVTHQDGIVARLMGDALLAFFGAPTTHEDDPQRAALRTVRWWPTRATVRRNSHQCKAQRFSICPRSCADYLVGRSTDS